MASRPLYDPPVSNTSVRTIFRPAFVQSHFQHRLSDHVMGVIQVGIRLGLVTKAKADVYETAFIRGAKPRKHRTHEGRAFLAPDGTAMSMFGVAYSGASSIAAGTWNLDNVSTHPTYATWLRNVVHLSSSNSSDSSATTGSSDDDDNKDEEDDGSDDGNNNEGEGSAAGEATADSDVGEAPALVATSSRSTSSELSELEFEDDRRSDDDEEFGGDSGEEFGGDGGEEFGGYGGKEFGGYGGKEFGEDGGEEFGVDGSEE